MLVMDSVRKVRLEVTEETALQSLKLSGTWTRRRSVLWKSANKALMCCDHHMKLEHTTGTVATWYIHQEGW